MSDERLEAIRGRLEAATDGPWTIFDVDGGVVGNQEIITSRRGHIAITLHGDHNVKAEFIAHAPSDLRYLLDRIEAQHEVVEAARSVDAEYHSLPHEKRGNLDRLMARLREALDQLEEQTDD